MGRQRETKDMSHEYLVESVQVLEGYVASMLGMLLQFHPYLNPAANEIGEEFQRRQAEVESRYPVSEIVLPSNGVLRGH